MSSTLHDEIRRVTAEYPDPRSAILPALRLAQDAHGGWLPEVALREVAEALDVTPAYCLSIASFYDMFHLEPVGRHLGDQLLHARRRSGAAARGLDRPALR